MTTEAKPKKGSASKASAGKKEAEKTASRQREAVKALRAAKANVEKAATEAKEKAMAVKAQIDTEENRAKVKAVARLSRMKAVKAKGKAETLFQKARTKAGEVAGQMEKAAMGHPVAESAMKQAKKAKARVEAAGEKLKAVKDSAAEQGKKARNAAKEVAGKAKVSVGKAVRAARKFKDTVDTPVNRAKVKDAACSVGSSLKDAVGDVIKEVAKARTKPAAKKATAAESAASAGASKAKAAAAKKATAAESAASAGASKAKAAAAKKATAGESAEAAGTSKAKAAAAKKATAAKAAEAAGTSKAKAAAAKKATAAKSAASAGTSKAKAAAAKKATAAESAKSVKGGRADEDTTELTAKELGLSSEEYGKICQLLGRNPGLAELSLYARMWSEEVSFKNSVKWLRTLSAEDGRLPVGAGWTDLGNGQFCILEAEAGSALPGAGTAASRLSRLEAAVMASGGRPLLVAACGVEGNDPASVPARCRIAASPFQGKDAAGEADPFFRDYGDMAALDILSVGMASDSPMKRVEKASKGDAFYLVGSTGDKGRQPMRQIAGSLQRDKAVLAVAEIGRSGLIEAFSRLCSQSGPGVRIDLSEASMFLENEGNWDGLLLHVPACYLVLARQGAQLQCAKDLAVSLCPVGEVIGEDRLRFYEQGRLVVDIPASSLAPGDGAPVYDRKYKEAKLFAQCKRFDMHAVEDIGLDEAARVARFLSAGMERDGRVGVAPLPEAKEGEDSLVLTMGSRARYVLSNPLAGAQIAVAEASRGLVCSGVRPLGMAACFHFGTPRNPEAYWQFVGAVKGVKAASEALRVPVAGADVDFAKPQAEDPKLDTVHPAVTVGMVGVAASRDFPGRGFVKEGHAIYLLGKCVEDIGGSRYLSAYRKQPYSPAPYFDPDEEYKLQRVVLDAIDSHLLESACPVSEGGLFMALLGSAMVNGLGFDIMVDDFFRMDSYLFGESQGRVVVTIDPAVDTEFKDLMMETKTPMVCLGEVTGGEILVDDHDFGKIEDYKH